MFHFYILNGVLLSVRLFLKCFITNAVFYHFIQQMFCFKQNIDFFEVVVNFAYQK